MSARLDKADAVRFIVLIGIVSLFADMTYEGARSIAGPFLQTLGASGWVVGAIAGFGELVGYALRLGSGLLADKTRRYWPIAIAGYVLNMGVVPLLAFAGSWPLAALLLVGERAGKGLRNPPRDAMLSYAAEATGQGWGFGLHEALDRTGAVLGPLIVAALITLHSGYSRAFAWLALPALATLAMVLVARRRFPHPLELRAATMILSAETRRRDYWVAAGALSLVGGATMDYPLIAFHFGETHAVPANWVPMLYALAMGVGAVLSPLLGKAFDRFGVPVLAGSLALAGLAPVLAFAGGGGWALSGAAFWGLGLGVQSGMISALIAGLTPPDKRASAFGTFNACFGLAWFAGSLVLGLIYDVSPWASAIVSALGQIAGALLLMRPLPP
jgi:MFS family permease